ncbi:Flagellin N-methylase [compost metagenome]
MSELLRQTIRDLPVLLEVTKGLGQGDWSDLYTPIDYMAFAFAKAYPSLPCRAGCSHCCRTQPFRVTRAEWEPLRQALLADPRRDGLLAQVVRDFGAHREALEAAERHWSEHPPEVPTAALQDVPRACPLLEGDRCGYYDVRPAICRAYGAFGAKVGEREVFLICQEHGPDFVRGLADHGHEALLMTPWNPVQERLSQFNPSGEVAPLPLWLLRLAEELESAQPASS